jgi:hypothetical protein
MRVRVVFLAVLALALFPVAAKADYPHVVQPGETLTSVAAVDGLSISAIAAANGISDQSQLIAGQTLMIPPRSTVTAGAGTASTTQTTNQTQTTSDHDVQFNTDPDADGDTDLIQTSTTQPDTQASTSEVTKTAITQSTTGAPTERVAAYSSSAPSPQPTPERVTAGEIAYVANANGVPAALAEAIAWQESGWNNDEVSGVGAVGVMQIVPGTWDWIDRYLTPSHPLGTTSAAENIRAGVLLLHQLLAVSGGDESLAVAGYFQGIASVKAHGMYASTRQYVANVVALTQRFGG